MQLDPVIIGDVAGDLSVDAGDVGAFDSFVAQLHPAQIPMPPTQLLPTDPNYVNPNSIHSPNAADPTLSLRGLTSPGSPSVSVNIDHPDPQGSTGLTSVTLALKYGPAMLSVTPADITLGSIPSQGSGWQLKAVVDQATGQIGIQLYSLTPITVNQAGSLVNIAFHAMPGSTVPSTSVQLVDTVTPNGQWFGTGVADSQSALILSLGVDRLLLPAGSDMISLVALSNPGSAETTGHANLRVIKDALAENDTQDSERMIGLFVGSGGEDKMPIANVGNGPGGWQTGNVISAITVATGIFGFLAPIATPQGGQMFQIGNLPQLNNLVYQNSPAQLATDRLFRALVRSTDDAVDLRLENPFLKSAIWDEAPCLDLLTNPGQFLEVGKEADFLVGTIHQLGTDQQSVEHRSELMAKDFADRARDGIEFSNLGND